MLLGREEYHHSISSGTWDQHVFNQRVQEINWRWERGRCAAEVAVLRIDRFWSSCKCTISKLNTNKRRLKIIAVMLCRALKQNADKADSKLFIVGLFLIWIILVSWFTAWPHQQLMAQQIESNKHGQSGKEEGMKTSQNGFTGKKKPQQQRQQESWSKLHFRKIFS